MTLQDFNIQFKLAKQQRSAIFQMQSTDPLASQEEVSIVEGLIGCRLHPSHREFLKEFGGGDFGFSVLFSVYQKSEWYLPAQIARNPVEFSKFIPISDNFSGDLYGFAVMDAQCVGELKRWDHEVNKIVITQFENVYDFMDRYALNPA